MLCCHLTFAVWNILIGSANVKTTSDWSIVERSQNLWKLLREGQINSFKYQRILKYPLKLLKLCLRLELSRIIINDILFHEKNSLFFNFSE